jgi:hypothetical protein
MPGEGKTRHDPRPWLVACGALVLVVGTIQLAAGGDAGEPILVAAPAGATEDTTSTTPTPTTTHAHTPDATHAADHAGDHTDTTHAHTPDATHAAGGDHPHTPDATHPHTDTQTAGHDHSGTGGTTDTTHDHGTTDTTHDHGTTDTTHDHGGGDPVGITEETLAEIDVARQVAVQYPTAADAERAGWRKITVFLPGIAAHYLRGEYLDNRFVLNQPEVLLYGGEGPDAPLVGVNYIVSGSTPPAGFTGDADHWHEHPTLCLSQSTGLIIGDEHVTSAECTAMGGTIINFSNNWLLHVWCIPGWEAPEGVFSHENSLVV